MRRVDSTAIISDKAIIGDEVEIGPYSIINGPAVIGKGTKIGSHVLIAGDTTIGVNCKIHHGAVIGTDPQDLKFGAEETSVVLGNNITIREYVTINRGTTESKMTKVGDNTLLMAYSHIAHDCRLGENVILANGVQLAGHVHIQDYATIGGLVAVHQFVSIGTHSMIGGSYRVTNDICPYALAQGYPLSVKTINYIGLKRHGFPPKTIEIIKSAFRLLFNSPYNTSDAVLKIKEELPQIKEIQTILEFIASSRRGLTKR